MKMDQITKISYLAVLLALLVNSMPAQNNLSNDVSMEKKIGIDLLVPNIGLTFHQIEIDKFGEMKSKGTIHKNEALSGKYRTDLFEDNIGRIYFVQFQFAGDDYCLRFNSKEDWVQFRGKVTLIPDATNATGFDPILNYWEKEADFLLHKYPWQPIPGFATEKDTAFQYGSKIMVLSTIFDQGRKYTSSKVFTSMSRVNEFQYFGGVDRSASAESPSSQEESRNEMRQFFFHGGTSRLTIIGEKEYNEIRKLPTTSVLQEELEGDRIIYHLQGDRILFADGLFLDEGQIYLIFESKEDYAAYLESFPQSDSPTTIFSNTFLEDPNWTFEPGKAGKELELLFWLEPGTLDYSDLSLQALDLTINSCASTPVLIEKAFPLVAVYCGEIMAKAKGVELIFEWNQENSAFLPMIRFPGVDRPQHYAHIVWDGLNDLTSEPFSSASFPMMVDAMAKLGGK